MDSFELDSGQKDVIFFRRGDIFVDRKRGQILNIFEAYADQIVDHSG